MKLVDDVDRVKFRLAGGRIDLDAPVRGFHGDPFFVVVNTAGMRFQTPRFSLPYSGTVVAVNVDTEHNITEVFYSD